MSKLEVGIDVDGVLRDFASSLINVYKKHYTGHEVTPVSRWNKYRVEGYFPIGKDIYKFFQTSFPNEIYTHAQPYPGAKKFMDELKSKYDVYIITQQPTDHIAGLTDKWLRYHNLDTGKIIFTQDKSRYQFDLVLDDCTDNLEAITLKESALAVAMDRPWNQDWKNNRVHKFNDFLKLADSYSKLK